MFITELKKYFNDSTPFEEIHIKDALYIPMFCLKFMGIWRCHHNFCPYKLYFTISMSLIAAYLLSQAVYLANVKNIEDLCNCYLLIGSLLTGVKWYFFRKYFFNFNEIYLDLSEDIYKPKNQRQGKMLQLLVKVTILLSVGLPLMAGTAVTAFPLEVLISNKGDRVLPLQGRFPFETLVSPNYEIIVVWQVVSQYFIAVSVSLIDGICAIYMLVIVGLCQVLCDDLRNLAKHQEGRLVQAIKLHKEILRLCKLGRPILGYIGFSHTLVASFAIGCLIFRFNMTGNSALEQFKLMTIFLSYYLELLYCFVGEIVNFESDKIRYAIYESKWVECSMSFKQNMKFLMLHAQPIQFTGLGLVDLSLSTMLTILRSTFSCFTLLNNLMQK